MALTTYTELKAAVASRLHRSDLTTQIVDYITIAEKRLNRLLNLTGGETEDASLVAVVSSRTLTLPSLYGKPIALYLTTYLPRIEIQYRLPTELQVLSYNGPASFWTIDGANLKTDAPADQAYTYTFRYSADYDIASTSTNTLLTNYPELYLYGALIEAGMDVKDDAMVSSSNGRFTQALQEATDDINATKKIAQLTTDFGGPRSNIFNG